jgi:hypothetical protein
VYSIFSRDKDRYLRGDGYKSWVNFFIPFNGGIGFHDASWRSTFGGNIYLYSGSHGCINMPYSAAKKLYENVTLDEKVIVYGGVDKVAGKAQSLGGADSYNVTEGDGAFNLGVTAEDNAKLTYSSDNEGVVRVDENGNVTIAGVGTATITVKSEATTSYKAGSKTITITVNAKPQPNQTPSVTIGCGNKTVTEGDAPFSLGASASNWKDLGGKDEAIVAIGREAASGTRGAFEELLDVKDQCKYAQELDSTGAVLAKVGSTPGAIGYVSLDVLDDTVTAMKIDGVEATEENIVAGKYLLSRPFVMATKGKIDEQNDIVKAWFDYVNSDEGQAVIKKVGLILPQ